MQGNRILLKFNVNSLCCAQSSLLFDNASSNSTCCYDCSYSRTPVDEALGKPFQDAVVTAVNSFYKQPLVEVEQMEEEASDEQQEDDVMEEDAAMEEHEGASSRP